MKKYLLIIIIPNVIFALSADLRGLVGTFLGLIDIIIPILSGFILILFFYGIGLFILSQGDIIKLKISKSYMIWSVVGMFLLVSLWGIIQLASNELEFGKITKPTLPQ